MHPAASAALTLARLPATRGVAPALDWPTQGSAALVIPSFGVKESTNDDVVPIASLTKMMTAYVTLQRLPLVGDATGPCITINDADLATYEHMNATGQSSVKVAARRGALRARPAERPAGQLGQQLRGAARGDGRRVDAGLRRP